MLTAAEDLAVHHLTVVNRPVPAASNIGYPHPPAYTVVMVVLLLIKQKMTTDTLTV
jgi:hypothetical protein